MACACRKTIDHLVRLGARHAARMHREGLSRAWTARDWLLHMDEEERLLFPVLRRRGLGPLVDRLLEHHDVFRREIRRRGEITSIDLLRRHAEMEDEMIAVLG